MSALREQIKLFVNQELSPEANAQRLIAGAKAGLAEAQASGRASHSYVSVIDGQRNGNIDNAKQQIVFEFSYLNQAAQFALDFLKTRSQPSMSGTFAKSFWVSIDGRYSPPGEFDPDAVDPDAKEIVIGNTQPYNRKIDIQLIGKQPLRYRTPVGLYEDGASATRRRYGNILTAKRAYDFNFPSKYRQSPRHTTYRFQSPVLILTLR